jgi:D-3-phosphoglycerate dehydrogenase
VFNTPGANAGGVKELVLCALFLSSRDFFSGCQWVKSIASKCDEVPALVEKGKSAYAGPEISGKTLVSSDLAPSAQRSRVTPTLWV